MDEEYKKKKGTRRGGKGKRSKKAKGDVSGDKNGGDDGAPPSTVHDVTNLFVSGGDIKAIGRAVTGPFTAEVLAARYKEEGTTVKVDPTFQFKDLVLNTEGATWSLGGGGGGNAVAGVGDARDGGGGGGGDGREGGAGVGGDGGEEQGHGHGHGGGGEDVDGEETRRQPIDADTRVTRADASPAAAAAAAVRMGKQSEAAAAFRRTRTKAVAAAARMASFPMTVCPYEIRSDHVQGQGQGNRLVVSTLVLGLTEEVLDIGRDFVRAASTEQKMVEEWYETRDAARDEYKRRRRQALRWHQKANQTGDKR